MLGVVPHYMMIIALFLGTLLVTEGDLLHITFVAGAAVITGLCGVIGLVVELSSGVWPELPLGLTLWSSGIIFTIIAIGFFCFYVVRECTTFYKNRKQALSNIKVINDSTSV
jgi:hypothetical protein